MSANWDFFTLLCSDTSIPTWPRWIPGNAFPPGQGGSVLSATPPVGLLTPAGRLILLKAVLNLNAGAGTIVFRHGDGATAYFDSGQIPAAAATGVELNIPLYNGLSVIGGVSSAGRYMICYRVIQ